MTSYKRKSKAANSFLEHKIKQKRIDDKNEQLNKTIAFCIDNNCRGYAAISAGVCPDIKDRRTINRRLDKELNIGTEKEYCQALTNMGEKIIVNYIKNKSEALQPVRRRDLNEVIIQMLKLRDIFNRRMKGGRKFIKLSSFARAALRNGKVGKGFWGRFDAKFKNLSKRRASTVALKRVLACTKEEAINHLDGLAAELIEAGIFVNAVQKEKGVWEGDIDTSRIFNHDETPQFVNYGQNGAAPELEVPKSTTNFYMKLNWKLVDIYEN